MPNFDANDGTRLYYEEAGTGTPVIALAGLTRNARDFDHVAPHLDVRLIRLDYRGRGKSDWADYHSYAIPQEAQDTLSLRLVAGHLLQVGPLRVRPFPENTSRHRLWMANYPWSAPSYLTSDKSSFLRMPLQT